MQKHHPIHNDDPRVIVLDRGNYTTCTILLRGACISSWKINHEEQIFVGRNSKMDDYTNYRGGISLVFPRFSVWRFGRKHGFARDLMWYLKKGPEVLDKGDVYVELFLPSNYYTRACWNYDFELRYSIILKTSQLETRIVVINTSPLSAFEFQFEQHSYLKVKDLRTCVILGLQGCYYMDQIQDGVEKVYIKQKKKEFTWSGHIDTVFRDSPPSLEIRSLEEQRSVIVTKTNLPDLNLWSPGETVKRIPDLDMDEGNSFIVVDFGNVCRKWRLSPNSFWTASQIFEIVKLNKPAPKKQIFWDYFDEVC